MSAGAGRQDVATFATSWPGNGVPAPATQMVAGVAQTTDKAKTAASGGSPTMPWVTLVLVLVLIRVLAHIRGAD